MPRHSYSLIALYMAIGHGYCIIAAVRYSCTVVLFCFNVAIVLLLLLKHGYCVVLGLAVIWLLYYCCCCGIIIVLMLPSRSCCVIVAAA